jgi:glucokinase
MGGASGDLLVADIGGTNARFAVSDRTGALHDVRVLSAAKFPNIDEAIASYLAGIGRDRPANACFAVACPTHGEEIKLTNSPWRFRKAAIAAEFGFARFAVINDFEALAASVPSLTGDRLQVLRPGKADPQAICLVIGPGTGLGVGGYVPAGATWALISGEGGHVGFAPTTDREVRLWQQMRAKYGRVSAERVLNGAGLANIHRFLAGEAGQAIPGIDGPEVSRRALAGDAIATEAVLLFFEILGSVAGDLALAFGARGGVYIGGGITPKLLDFARRSQLVARFLDKGRIADLLAPVPISVIMDERAALYGAWRTFNREAT